MKHNLEIYTDGACSGNPGPGGWGSIVMMGDCYKEISGYNPKTTNNQMELTACIEILKIIKEPCNIKLTTDSTYVIDGITKWIEGWKRRNWKGAKNSPVKNRELWEQLDVQNQRHNIQWLWIRGHIGHEFNERCDYLARKQIEDNKVL